MLRAGSRDASGAPASNAPVKLAEIWRYPVKSMAGEPLSRAALGPDGIPGDRVVHVEDARGRVVTSRSRPRLLLLHATLGPDGEPLVDGRPWRRADVARDVEQAAGAGARLVRDEGPDRFDVLPLLVATDGAIDSLGYDRRRFRPNLLLSGVPGLAERGWEGKHLRIGDAIIRIVNLRERCIMTTFDPDTAEQDVEVLLRIHRELGGMLALNCEVVRAGAVGVGDGAEVTDADHEEDTAAVPAHLVRLARPADLGLLAGIENAAGELFAPYPFAQTADDVITPAADLRAGLEDGTLFVAEADAAVVGFALASPLDGGMHLDEIDVLPAYGRRGIGAALVAAVVDCARRRGLPHLTLSTLRSIPWNAPWYERLGFRILAPAEITPVLRGLLDHERARGLPMADRVLMKLTL